MVHHLRLGKVRTELVLKTGARKRSPHFLVTMTKKPGIVGFSCVVSKKVAHTAILRNKIRRRVYGALRTLSVSGVLGVVTVTSRDILEIPFQSLVEELQNTLS